MEDTVTFLHEIYRRQAAVSTIVSPNFPNQESRNADVRQVQPCELEITGEHRVTAPAQGDWWGPWPQRDLYRKLFSLRESDPLSVSVERKTAVEGGGQPYFVVAVARGIYFVSLLPLPVDAAKPPIEIAANARFNLHGFVVESSGSGLTLIGHDGNRYRLPASFPNIKWSRDDHPATVADAVAGDRVQFTTPIGKNPGSVELSSATPAVLPEKFARFVMPELPDEDTANRVAKALIHAMALCQGDKKPLAF